MVWKHPTFNWTRDHPASQRCPTKQSDRPRHPDHFHFMADAEISNDDTKPCYKQSVKTSCKQQIYKDWINYSLPKIHSCPRLVIMDGQGIPNWPRLASPWQKTKPDVSRLIGAIPKAPDQQYRIFIRTPVGAGDMTKIKELLKSWKWRQNSMQFPTLRNGGKNVTSWSGAWLKNTILKQPTSSPPTMGISINPA